MDYKKSKAPVTTITRNMENLDKDTGNIFETINICSKRANQISVELKQELNREQIEISKFYERLPKPSLISLEEYAEGQIYYRNPEKE